VGNTALSFVNVYRKLLQPIAREQMMPGLAHEDYGFSFNNGDVDTGLRAVLPGGAKSIFEEMTIHQIFVERGSDASDPSSWLRVVNFVFMNPKFTNIDIDDLDHENGGNFNIVTMSVDFDAVYMDHPRFFNSESGGPSFKGGDIPNNGRGGSSAQGGYPADRNARGRNNRNYVRPSMPGMSQGGARSVEDTMNYDGLRAGTRPVRSMMGGGSQSFARPSSDLLTDNATSPSETTWQL
jgi:hypothetical protein